MNALTGRQNCGRGNDFCPCLATRGLDLKVIHYSLDTGGSPRYLTGLLLHFDTIDHAIERDYSVIRIDINSG
jgi:hypothetical protein